MQGLISITEGKQSLADVYPPSIDYSMGGKQTDKQDNKPKYIESFDALYPNVSREFHILSSLRGECCKTL